MNPYHRVEDVYFEGDYLHVAIDGQSRSFKLPDISPQLAEATEQEKQTFEISPVRIWDTLAIA